MAEVDQRRFPRLLLDIEDGYFGNFKLANQETLVAPIMNLSAGGLNMAVATSAMSKVKKGDELLLQHIAGGTRLSFLNDIRTGIRWVKPLDQPGYIYVGCEFDGITNEVRLQLVEFVDSERLSRGQYE